MENVSVGIPFHCRAVILLQKELFKLKRYCLAGIEVFVEDDDIFNWNVVITGLHETIWKDIQLSLSLKFCESYNDVPPQVKFTTIPFHPNVNYNTGDVCSDILQDWNPLTAISYLLLSLQNMLSYPSLNDPLNKEAAEVYSNSFQLYQKLIMEKTKTLPANQDEITSSTNFLDEATQNAQIRNFQKPKHHISKLSYEDYYQTWKHTGTSKAAKEKICTVSDISGDHFDARRYDLIRNDVDEEFKRQHSDHKMLMYGQFEKDKKKKEKLISNKKQLIRDICSHRSKFRSLHVSVPTSPVEYDAKYDGNNKEIDAVDEEISPLEMKELLVWSQNISDEILK